MGNTKEGFAKGESTGFLRTSVFIKDYWGEGYVQCTGTTKSGNQCKARALEKPKHDGKCVIHSPATPSDAERAAPKTAHRAKVPRKGHLSVVPGESPGGREKKRIKPKPSPRKKPAVQRDSDFSSGMRMADRRPERARDPNEYKDEIVLLALKGKMAALQEGKISIADMDDEEIARMRFRDANGGFSGKPPGVIPRPLVDELRKELFKRLNASLYGIAPIAIEALQEIIRDPAASDADKLRAINMVLERVMGKTPDKVELSSGEKPFQVLLGGISRDVKEEPVKVIEGEVLS